MHAVLASRPESTAVNGARRFPYIRVRRDRYAANSAELKRQVFDS